MPYVLVIDDDESVCNMLRQHLQLAGYEVAVAGNGFEGLKSFHERRPTLVITDLIMPEADGIEAIMELRKLDPVVKIIAISGGSRLVPTDMLYAAKMLGAARTFIKPLDVQELLAAVAELIAH
jgi:DNA-binding NtrC family response regulator